MRRVVVTGFGIVPSIRNAAALASGSLTTRSFQTGGVAIYALKDIELAVRESAAGMGALRKALLAILMFVVVACGPRGNLEFAAPVPNATAVDIWVARFRPTEPPKEGQRAPPRPSKVAFEKTVVSIPPSHQAGQIHWPHGAPDANTDFVTLSNRSYPNLRGFAADVHRADTGKTGETVLFVHGYNMRHGEAVYQLAQVSNDFSFPSPAVLFSWPSAGVKAGYLFDRDSALFARDQLEQVIRGLTAQSGQKVVLLGHSMGNLLIMETLRQLEIAGDFNVGTRIGGLIMVSPDIDGELFYAQASRLKTIPQPAIVIAARQDRALWLSALLTGRSNRLGSQTDRSSVRDLPIVVIDASDMGGRGANHDIALSSPAAISMLKKLDAKLLPSENKLPSVIDLGRLARGER